MLEAIVECPGAETLVTMKFDDEAKPGPAVIVALETNWPPLIYMSGTEKPQATSDPSSQLSPVVFQFDLS